MKTPDQTPASADVLLISNGNGEDSIAAAVAQRLPASLKVFAYPIVGPGVAFEGVCPVIGPRTYVPSEGWRHTKWSIMRDVFSGLPAAVIGGARYLHSLKGRFRKVILIGDGTGPMICQFAGLHIDLYVDVFKSGYAHRYNRVERAVLKRSCGKVYCRDDTLASSLRHSGIDASSPGNIMMDVVPRSGIALDEFRESPQMVLLLPGSREVVGENLNVQVEVIERLMQVPVPDVFVAVAPGIQAEQLERQLLANFRPGKSAQKDYLGILQVRGVRLHLVRGALGDLVENADVILSQAGTATQQAVGLGKPVLTFNRRDNRPKRMADEQALMNEGRILAMPDPAKLAQIVDRLLHDPAERERRGAIGRQRMGGSGVLNAILEEVGR